MPIFTNFYLKQNPPKVVNVFALKMQNAFLRASDWWEYFLVHQKAHRLCCTGFNLWPVSGRRIGQFGHVPEPKAVFLVGSKVTLRHLLNLRY